MADLIGVNIGSYRILRRLGEGGTSTVYEALNQEIGRRAAIKVLNSDLSSEGELLRRFFQEARAVNIIQDPGIVSIIETGELLDGTAYIIMEYLEGELLADRLDRNGGSLPASEAIRLARQIASSLVAAHRKGIIHRDLKPDNVMIVPDAEAPGGERTKILDFGIAKLAAEHLSTSKQQVHMTGPGITMGTPIYMSPEQLRAAAVEPKSDVYSLGISLFQMLAGRPPFVSGGTAEISASHLYEQPPQLRGLVRSVSEELAGLVHAMIAKNIAERPTMEEVAQRLERLGAPKATGQLAAISRASHELPRSKVRWIDPYSATAAKLATKTQSFLVGLKERPFFFWVALLAGVAIVLELLVVPRLRARHDPGPIPAPTAGASLEPPVAQKVQLAVRSEPPGAEVFRVFDGVRLGVTPWQSQRACEEGTLPVLLRLPGYRDRRVELTLTHDDERVEKLVANSDAASAAEPKGKRRSSKHRRSKHGHGAKEEATP